MVSDGAKWLESRSFPISRLSTHDREARFAQSAFDKPGDGVVVLDEKSTHD